MTTVGAAEAPEPGARPVGQRRRRGRLVLAAVATAAAVVAVLTAAQQLQRRTGRAELSLVLAETGLDGQHPAEVSRILADPDPVRARLAVSRLLVADALDLTSGGGMSPRRRMEAAAGVGSRLQVARALAADALRRRPAAWQAPMLIGASRYLEWLLRGDARLVSDAEAWRGPLRLASRMAPGEGEPLQFLALADLEVWPVLDDADRDAARGLLRQAFADRRTLRRAAARWISVAADRDEAFAVVPDEPWAWRLLQDAYAARGDWDGVVAAHLRHDAALEPWLAAQLAEMERRLRGGDSAAARAIVVAMATAAPPNGSWAEPLERALQIMPPGPVPRAAARPLREWLDWAVARWLCGRDGLSPVVIRRLTVSLPELPAHRRALAALAGGRLADAESLERRSEAVSTSDWALYTIGKARTLLDRGEPAAAEAVLDLTAPGWRDAPLYLDMLERAARGAGDGARAAAARQALADARRATWPGTRWRWTGNEASLEVEVPAGTAFTLAFDVVPAGGAVVEVAVDGDEAAVAHVLPGRLLKVERALAEGRHRLRLATVAGGRVVPGDVRVDDVSGFRTEAAGVYTRPARGTRM